MYEILSADFAKKARNTTFSDRTKETFFQIFATRFSKTVVKKLCRNFKFDPVDFFVPTFEQIHTFKTLKFDFQTI